MSGRTIVNLGDAMVTLTNGTLRSNPYCVAALYMVQDIFHYVYINVRCYAANAMTHLVFTR
jgi:hypothetical protein